MEISTNVSVAPNSAAKNTPFAQITAQELKATWRKGHHTTAGYLNILIQTLRADGWWLQINNVSEFCREWEISRKSFYKAKAQLIREGSLEEKIIGRLDIRIPVCQGVPQLSLVTTDTVPVSLLGNTCYPPVTTCYPTVTAAPLGNTDPLETLSQLEVCNSTDLRSDLDQLTTTPNPPPVVVDKDFVLENQDPKIQEVDLKTDRDLTKETQDLKEQDQSQNLNKQNSLNSKGISEDKSSAAAADPEIFQKKLLLDEIAKALAPQPVTKAIAKSVNELTAPAIRQAIFAFHEYKANEIAKGNTINSPIALMIAALKGEHQTPWVPNKPKAPTEWNEWFGAAQNLGLVRYSQGLPNGDIQVAMSDGTLRLFSELVQEYPLDKLKA